MLKTFCLLRPLVIKLTKGKKDSVFDFIYFDLNPRNPLPLSKEDRKSTPIQI